MERIYEGEREKRRGAHEPVPHERECACQSQEEHHRRNAGWQRRVRQNPQAVVWDLNAHQLLDQYGRPVPENEKAVTERFVSDPEAVPNLIFDLAAKVDSGEIGGFKLTVRR
jgi:hypothetical protein